MKILFAWSRNANVARICIAVLLAHAAMSGYAQEVPNPVSEFLVAFHGKPVGPVAAPQTSAASAIASQTYGGNSSRASTSTAQPEPSTNAPFCPPGVDRVGCPSSSGQRVRNDCPAGMTASPSGCVPMAMPSNAHRISADGQWQCDDGFMRFGSICMAIQATPPNAHLTGTGTNWECNTGFRRVGNFCSVVNIPPNAHLAETSTGWACDSGYRMANNWCMPH